MVLFLLYRSGKRHREVGKSSLSGASEKVRPASGTPVSRAPESVLPMLQHI